MAGAALAGVAAVVLRHDALAGVARAAVGRHAGGVVGADRHRAAVVVEGVARAAVGRHAGGVVGADQHRAAVVVEGAGDGALKDRVNTA